MATLFYKRNDTSPSISFPVTRGSAPVDLTGATVRFKIMNSANVQVNTSTSTCVIVNAIGTTTTPASVRYDLTAGDTAVADTYNAELEITFASGRPETWPNGSTDPYVVIVVTADV
jgi:BppU N-terminal domain